MNADHSLKDVSTVHMAFVTGHKLTDIKREPTTLQGLVYLCRLDGELMRLTEARRILERQYLAKPR